MMSRSAILVTGMILGALIVTACLGEPILPALEDVPAPTLAPEPVDPTVAASPRLNLDLAGQPPGASQVISQVPHDLIGRGDCLMCHKHGVGDSPRVPDGHRGLDSSTCQTCHTAPVSAELSGAEMYTRICARCHGESGEGKFGPALNVKEYLRSVTDADLRAAILRGSGTSEMMAWGDLGLLTERQIDGLVAMIRAWEPTAPESPDPLIVGSVNAAFGDPEQGETLYAQYCTGCHGLRGETAVGDGFVLRENAASLDDAVLARQISDGVREMPSFHALLTADDINDLLALIRDWQSGPLPTATPIVLSGEEVFARVCSRCHGQNGEGGIALALNSKEFLTANDDQDIRQWIMRGTLGTSMLSWGDLGLITAEQLDELVAYIRAWEPTAPSTGDGQAAPRRPSAAAGDTRHGQQLFAQFCSGCHGLSGEHQTGEMILNSEEFLNSVNDEILASQIQNGGREMPSFHSVLTSQDVNDLLAFMRSGFSAQVLPTPAEQDTSSVPSFSADVMPVLVEECALCHGTAGGWSAATYDEVLNSGLNAPAVIPGDPDGSLLVQKLRGTQTSGGLMPPGRSLPAERIDLIVRWITAGAPDN